MTGPARAPDRPRVRELTGRGPGGVRIVELRGPGALDCARALAGGRREWATGALRLARLAPSAHGAEAAIDEVLVHVAEPGRVELGVHGGPAVVRRLTEELAGVGAEGPASPPAPATLEEDALALVPAAASESGARVLLDQAGGALRRGLVELAHADGERFRVLRARLERRARWLELARRPARVVLAGPANAGKSTLFNLLAGRERVVVAATPGTTRDVVRERVALGAWPVELVDSAGERASPGGSVEEQGLHRARAEREGADLCLWLESGAAESDTGPPADAPDARVVRVRSRAPKARRSPSGGGSIATLEEPDATRRVVEEAFRTALRLPADPWEPGAPVPFRPEHVAALADWAERDPDERLRRWNALLPPLT